MYTNDFETFAHTCDSCMDRQIRAYVALNMSPNHAMKWKATGHLNSNHKYTAIALNPEEPYWL